MKDSTPQILQEQNWTMSEVGLKPHHFSWEANERMFDFLPFPSGVDGNVLSNQMRDESRPFSREHGWRNGVPLLQQDSGRKFVDNTWE